MKINKQIKRVTYQNIGTNINYPQILYYNMDNFIIFVENARGEIRRLVMEINALSKTTLDYRIERQSEWNRNWIAWL